MRISTVRGKSSKATPLGLWEPSKGIEAQLTTEASCLLWFTPLLPFCAPKGQLQNELIAVRTLSQDAMEIQPKTDQEKGTVWPLQSLPGYHFPNELINTDRVSTTETEKPDIFSSLAGSVCSVKQPLPMYMWLYWICIQYQKFSE